MHQRCLVQTELLSCPRRLDEPGSDICDLNAVYIGLPQTYIVHVICKINIPLPVECVV